MGPNPSKFLNTFHAKKISNKNANATATTELQCFHERVTPLLPPTLTLGGKVHNLRPITANDLQFIMVVQVLFFVLTGAAISWRRMTKKQPSQRSRKPVSVFMMLAGADGADGARGAHGAHGAHGAQRRIMAAHDGAVFADGARARHRHAFRSRCVLSEKTIYMCGGA